MWLYHVGPQWAKRLTLTGDTVTGAEAPQIGLVLKAVPREHLESGGRELADRLAMIDPDLLSANKRIINLGLELMGARTLQRLAAENDARGHNTAAARASAETRAGEGTARRRCASATRSSATAARASTAPRSATRTAASSTARSWEMLSSISSASSLLAPRTARGTSRIGG